MVVVKNLALGVLTGMMASPSLGGASKHGQHSSSTARGELQAPTTLSYASPDRPIGAAAAENLARTGGNAGTGSIGIGNSGYGPAYGFGNAGNGYGNTLGTTSSVWGSTTANALGTTSGPAITVQAAYSTPAVYDAPPVANKAVSPPVGMSTSGLQGGGNSSGGHSIDAYLNFGTSAYSEASALTTGNAQPWYTSPAVQHVFNGTPTASQQAGFIADVMQTVQHTYALGGMNVSLTADPSQNFAHTMSVVSGTSYGPNPEAIGITDVGNDGYSFIDKFGQAKTEGELATAVGHNIAHELMHAFGIADHPDQTGTHIDAATATWGTLTSAEATLSGDADQLLSTRDFLSGPGKNFTQVSLGLTGLELLAGHPTFTGEEAVPEPTAIALWGLAGGIALACHRRRKLA